MAQAHDLLTSRRWTGANVVDVITRAVDAFNPAQVRMSGLAIEVSPNHVFTLSLALHELATNATKYGALSCPEGHVNVQWSVEAGRLHLHWEEAGGPLVVRPTREGFGSQLLQGIVAHELGGETKLSYDVSGVRCTITAKL
jgi:two-component sensor histidine kinase